MMLLALETANESCSVSLYDGQRIVAHRQDGRSREQTRLLLPMIDAVLAEQNLRVDQLAAIAFSRGPGSFSGVRINAAVTQALAWAHDLPVIPVSSLQALAQAAYRQHQLTHVIALIDARMNELYSAAYALDAQQLMQPGETHTEQLGAYDQWSVPSDDNTYVLVGNGSLLATQADSDGEGLRCYPAVQASSEDIAVLGYAVLQAGQALSAEQALPVYLRDNAWKKIPEQQRRD